MAKVFVSYSRADLAAVTQIEGQLKAFGLETWRDQDRLYGGQSWPKALGEAIVAQDAFLLFWSLAGAQSHFVEVEWTTAVALKKAILPCRLDDTPLPPTLRAIQAVDGRDAESAAARIQDALSHFTAVDTHTGDRAAVIANLARIPATDPGEVARAVRQLFQQDHWAVQGNVYQAAGDININTADSTTAQNPPSWMATWQARLALLLALLTGLGTLFDLPEKAQKASQVLLGKSSKPATLEQTLSGVVWDDQRQPVAGAKVSILELGVSAITDASGGFHFALNAEKEQSVRLWAQKTGFSSDPQYATLGAKVDLSLRKAP